MGNIRITSVSKKAFEKLPVPLGAGSLILNKDGTPIPFRFEGYCFFLHHEVVLHEYFETPEQYFSDSG